MVILVINTRSRLATFIRKTYGLTPFTVKKP